MIPDTCTLPPLPEVMPVCTFRAQRYIGAFNIRPLEDRHRPYSVALTVTRWVERLARRNGLVPGHDIRSHLETTCAYENVTKFRHEHVMQGVGIWARERTVYTNDTYVAKELVTKRRLVFAFDSVYVGDCPEDVQAQVWRCQSMIQIQRELKVFVGRPLLSPYSEPSSPEWLKNRNDSYRPEKLRW